MSAGRHLIDVGYRHDDGLYHPSCSCGWSIPATRWGSAALDGANVHLASVGAETIPTERDTRTRRYLGAGR